MGIPPDSAGGGGLGRTGGRASGGGWNIKKGVKRGKAEREGVEVVVWSMDWKALLVSLAWSIL